MFTAENPVLVSESSMGRWLIYWDEFNGRQFLHIRLWYQDKESGEYKPSRKGTAIPEYKVPAFLEGIKIALAGMPALKEPPKAQKVESYDE